jgi:hypothetical protein
LSFDLHSSESNTHAESKEQASKQRNAQQVSMMSRCNALHLERTVPGCSCQCVAVATRRKVVAVGACASLTLSNIVSEYALSQQLHVENVFVEVPIDPRGAVEVLVEHDDEHDEHAEDQRGPQRHRQDQLATIREGRTTPATATTAAEDAVVFIDATSPITSTTGSRADAQASDRVAAGGR